MDHNTAFAARVCEGMRRQGITLRGLCREIDLDPSFFSKILSGKRSPPADEKVLRHIARLLGIDPPELIVAAGRIPWEWKALWDSPELFREVNAKASGISHLSMPPPSSRYQKTFEHPSGAVVVGKSFPRSRTSPAKESLRSSWRVSGKKEDGAVRRTGLGRLADELL